MIISTVWVCRFDYRRKFLRLEYTIISVLSVFCSAQLMRYDKCKEQMIFVSKMKMTSKTKHQLKHTNFSTLTCISWKQSQHARVMPINQVYVHREWLNATVIKKSIMSMIISLRLVDISLRLIYVSFSPASHSQWTFMYSNPFERKDKGKG